MAKLGVSLSISHGFDILFNFGSIYVYMEVLNECLFIKGELAKSF